MSRITPRFFTEGARGIEFSPNLTFSTDVFESLASVDEKKITVFFIEYPGGR